jgi:hypothetical protein
MEELEEGYRFLMSIKDDEDIAVDAALRLI